MNRSPRLSHHCGEVERFEDVCDLRAVLNFRTIASTCAQIEPLPSFYARQVHGMRLEDIVFVASDKVPSSPIRSVGDTFLYNDGSTSVTDHFDGVIKKRRIPQDLQRSKGFRHRFEVDVRISLLRFLHLFPFNLLDAHGHLPTNRARQLINVKPPHPNERLDFNERSSQCRL